MAQMVKSRFCNASCGLCHSEMNGTTIYQLACACACDMYMCVSGLSERSERRPRPLSQGREGAALSPSPSPTPHTPQGSTMLSYEEIRQVRHRAAPPRYTKSACGPTLTDHRSHTRATRPRLRVSRQHTPPAHSEYAAARNGSAARQGQDVKPGRNLSPLR